MGAFDDAASSSIGALQQALLAHANQPVSPVPTSNVPLTSNQPILKPSLPPVYQSPEPTTANRPGGYRTTGERKRDEKAALFHNIASLTKSITDYEVQKKQRHMELTTTRLMDAISGYNNAKSSNDQEGMKTNADIVNHLLDPSTPEGKKNLKMFEKAFDINFFGNSKGQGTPEQKGLFAAFQKYKQDYKQGKSMLNPLAQRLMSQFPTGPQLTPQAKAQIEAIKGGLQPSADTNVQAQTAAATQQQENVRAVYRGMIDLKVAQLEAGRIQGEGTYTVDTDPNSLTGVKRVQMSPDGKNMRVIPNVVMPSILPSTSQHEITQTVEDPKNPGHQIVVVTPTFSSRQKAIPGVGTVGAGGIVNHGQTPQTKSSVPTKSISTSKPSGTTDNPNKDLLSKLPPGSRIIAPKALSMAQVKTLEEGVGAMQGTVERLQDLAQYTELYHDMFTAGRIKYETDPITHRRILAEFLPVTDKEQRAAAAWQESAEYMNSFRKSLNAQGFRSIPAYDNMLNLRGNLFQDKLVLDKTLKDSIDFMNKQIAIDQKLLGEANTPEAQKDREERMKDPGGFLDKTKEPMDDDKDIMPNN